MVLQKYQITQKYHFKGVCMEDIKLIFNTTYQYRKQVGNGELAKILMSGMLDKDFDKIMLETYDIYKRFRNRDSTTEQFWDELIIEDQALFNKYHSRFTGDLLDYFVKYFDKKGKEK